MNKENEIFEAFEVEELEKRYEMAWRGSIDAFIFKVSWCFGSGC